MALLSTDGDELDLVVDPGTKKYTLKWTNGDVAFSKDMKETVMSLLVENEGPFTANRRRGPGPLSVGIDNPDTESKIKARAEERLQLALDDGRLRSIDVQVKRLGPGKFAAGVGYVTRSGHQAMINVPVGS
jgi:hypothetical protein